MSGRDFARYVSDYLGRYLPGQRNLSANTIASYRDMFKLMIDYFGGRGKAPEKMSMDDLSKGEVEGFMAWLTDRGCSDSTVNQRLCAVKSFINYVKAEDPARLLQYQQVLSIKQRKKAGGAMVVPGRDGLAAMLRNPDTSDRKGRRDIVLLTLLYDSGARVSELCRLTLRDVRLDEPAVITLTGKGGKTRVVPLMGGTADLLARHVDETYPHRDASDLDRPLFPGPRGMPLTRAGVSDIVKRHARGAREAGFAIPEGVKAFMGKVTGETIDLNLREDYCRKLCRVSRYEVCAKLPEHRKGITGRKHFHIILEHVRAVIIVVVVDFLPCLVVRVA